jgi:F-type H+-transporting ATPase subunit epsilon
MPGTLTLRIITPERIVLEEQVEQVTAMAIDGELSIMPDHEPLVTALGMDVLRYVAKKEDEFVAVLGGVLEVRNNEVTVLSDAAELGQEIDQTRAKEAKERAEAAKTQKTDKLDVYVAEMAIGRAMARLKTLEYREQRKRLRR